MVLSKFPNACLFPAFKIPSFIVTPPVNVFAPLRIQIEGPVFSKAVAPPFPLPIMGEKELVSPVNFPPNSRMRAPEPEKAIAPYL